METVTDPTANISWTQPFVKENSVHKNWSFSIKDFFSKFDQIHRKLRIWSHLLKISLMENFIFFTLMKILSLTSQWWPNCGLLITFTVWKVSVFRVFLFRIFLHSDWIWRDAECLLFKFDDQQEIHMIYNHGIVTTFQSVQTLTGVSYLC